MKTPAVGLLNVRDNQRKDGAKILNKENKKVFTLQTHIHGSGGHGRGSHRGYDYIVSRENAVDTVWWMEHDWRLANFAKVRNFSFADMKELFRTPERDAGSEQFWRNITMQWKRVNGNDLEGAKISQEKSYQGNSSLRMALPGAGELTYRFEVENARQIKGNAGFEKQKEVIASLRIQIVRPGLKESEYRGLISVSNPLYLTTRAIPTSHRIRKV